MAVKFYLSKQEATIGNKLINAARMKSSAGDCCFFLVEREFWSILVAR